MPRPLPWFVAGVIALVGGAAHAGNDEEGRPWARGTWAVGPVLGFGFGPDVTNLEFGATGEYYVLHGWSFGLELSDEIFIYSSRLRAEFPGLQDQIATNAVYLTPRSRYVFYRSYRFSPWAIAGLGPVFFNHGGGTAAQWIAGPGAYIGIAGPVYLSLGVTFSGMFPRSNCRSAFDYVDPAMPDTQVQFELGGAGIGSLCGFNWTPQIGIVFAPRAKTRRERKQSERQRRAPLPPNPMLQPPPEPEPEPAPEPEPEPLPAASPPPESPLPVGPEPPPDADAPDAGGVERPPPEGAPSDSDASAPPRAEPSSDDAGPDPVMDSIPN